jgi:hypothetical protein
MLVTCWYYIIIGGKHNNIREQAVESNIYHITQCTAQKNKTRTLNIIIYSLGRKVTKLQGAKTITSRNEQLKVT